MKRREFMHTSSSTGPLAQNQSHNFALGQTMRIYSASACYTWIPKNACSTMRFSVAVANGCISDISDINWIHANNKSFNVNTETAFLSDYTFVILRCPYQGIYSAFMDKFVNLDMQAWLFGNLRNRSFHPHDLTFRTLLAELKKTPVSRYDIHLRHQSAFLLYKEYDDYFRLEDFPHAASTIERKTGISIIDTRDALRHDTAKLKVMPDFKDPMDIPVVEILEQKRQGNIPDPKAMFDEQIASEVKAMYAEDIALYERKFGKSELMNFFDARAD